MKKVLKTAIFASFLVAGILMLTRVESVTTEAATFEGTVSSRSLYIRHCASCHGANGKSQTPEGRELLADDLTTNDVKGANHAKLVRIISNGKGDMPAYMKKLSTAQINSIAKYIKSL